MVSFDPFLYWNHVNFNFFLDIFQREKERVQRRRLGPRRRPPEPHPMYSRCNYFFQIVSKQNCWGISENCFSPKGLPLIRSRSSKRPSRWLTRIRMASSLRVTSERRSTLSVFNWITVENNAFNNWLNLLAILKIMIRRLFATNFLLYLKFVSIKLIDVKVVCVRMPSLSQWSRRLPDPSISPCSSLFSVTEPKVGLNYFCLNCLICFVIIDW